MEDSRQFSHVPEVPASWTFELSGHVEKWLGDWQYQTESGIQRVFAQRLAGNKN